MTTYNAVFGTDTIPPSDYSYAAVSLTANTTFEWPSLATSANLIADIMGVTPSGAGLAMTMPAANQVSTANPVLIRNLGADTFTVNDNVGSVITTVATGVSKLVYITSNATAAGTWASFTYGTGTSAADAAALAGYGTKATSATLSTKIATTEKMSGWTVATTDRAELFVVTSGTITATLPLVATAGEDFYFSIRNSGTGTVTVSPQTGELIDGQASMAMAPNESAFIVCSGSAWYSLGYGRSTEFQFTKLVLDVTAGGTFTLTSAEASNKLLQFTGTPTSSITVVVPDVVAVYYTQNSYSGSNTLTVKTSGGSGVGTAAATRSILYCDGTNVVQAQTAAVSSTNLAGGVAGSLVYQSAADTTAFSAAGVAGQIVLSGGVGSPTFTDNLTVAQGGTGRQTGTTAYSLVATGTTATGPQQTLTNGAVGELLVGMGASALPTWKAKGAGSYVLSMNSGGTDIEWRAETAATNPSKFDMYKFFDGL